MKKEVHLACLSALLLQLCSFSEKFYLQLFQVSINANQVKNLDSFICSLISFYYSIWFYIHCNCGSFFMDFKYTRLDFEEDKIDFF